MAYKVIIVMKQARIEKPKLCQNYNLPKHDFFPHVSEQ